MRCPGWPFSHKGELESLARQTAGGLLFWAEKRCEAPDQDCPNDKAEEQSDEGGYGAGNDTIACHAGFPPPVDR